MQTALGLVFPPQCVICGEMVDHAFQLCSRCWAETPFIAGLVCDACGTPLPGSDTGHRENCDDCLTIARPWDRGRAALLYRNGGKRLVLALKHGDRQDLARPAALWMAAAARQIAEPDMAIVPVPVHWLRLLQRRYNQAALLANRVGRALDLPVLPDALIRPKRTKVQDGMTRDQRFQNLSDAFAPHPRRGTALAGRSVLLVDDVMTSGATLAAAAEACRAAGAARVSVLALARVAKDA